MSRNDGSIAGWFRNARYKIGLYNLSDLGHLLKIEAANQSMGYPQRSLISDDLLLDMVDQVLRHPNNYPVFRLYAENQPQLRIIVERIMLETNKLGSDNIARFSKKCTVCGTEYKRPVTSCECGSEKLRDPDRTEKMKMDAFFNQPNRDDNIEEIDTSILADGLPLANAFLYYKTLKVKDKNTRHLAVYNEDAVYIHIASDKGNRLGNREYFCPDCYSLPRSRTVDGEVRFKDTSYSEQQYLEEHNGKCPKCEGLLYETAYIQKKNGTTYARWHRDEMVHFNFFPRLPRRQGRSPMAALMQSLRTAVAMGKNNFANYELGRLAKLIVVKGEGQDVANAISKGLADQLAAQVQRERYVGKAISIHRQLFVGAKKGMEVHDALPDPAKMQSLEWLNHYMNEEIAPMYFVQPVMINANQGGGGGYFKRMELVINADGVRRWQRILERGWAEVVKAMGIKDWEHKYNDPVPRNEREDAQNWKEKITAGQMAVHSGLEASITDEGELKIGGGPIVKAEGMFNSTRTDNLPPDPNKPRQEGDQNIIPGDDN